MMDESGHKSIDTPRGYVRDAELFKDHAGSDCFERQRPRSSTRQWKR